MDENASRENGEQGNDLNTQLEAALRQAAESHDKYLRALAESENMRKRLERLCEERMWQEKKRLLTHMVEIGDHLEDALKYAEADDPVEAGIRITSQQLQKTLAQEGVQPVESMGNSFDPSIHEAVELAESTGEPNTVLLEYRKAYKLDGRLLRPARVQVSKSAG